MLQFVLVQRRKLNLKAKFESGSSGFSFKRLVPGAFYVGLIGSTCTARPWSPGEKEKEDEPASTDVLMESVSI
jgi:hypothetical protein